MKLDYVASPHFGSRKGHSVEGTVIHYTAGGSASGTVAWFANPSSKVSAHFVVSRSGRIVQMVQLQNAAWHAGASEMLDSKGEMLSNANLFTVGIELANRGFVHKLEHGFFYELGGQLRRYQGEEPQHAVLSYDNGITVDGYWEPYSDTQLEATQYLLQRIAKECGTAAAHNIVGHEEIAMPFGTRKRDPGPLFPWARFHRKYRRRTKGLWDEA